MKNLYNWVLRFAGVLCLAFALTACGNGSKVKMTESAEVSDVSPEVQETAAESSASEITQETDHSSGMIYLYGESHGQEAALEYQLEQWNMYYHEQGMRHLFVERSYYGAEYLNLWMAAEDDAILDQLYEDWVGTASQVPCVKEFYQRIKKECPETVFHGTDVGHAYGTTGYRFMEFLKNSGQEKSKRYELAELSVKQGKEYGVGLPDERRDHAARENAMTENFIREFDALEGESVMGIYGSAHTDIHAMNFTNEVPCMAAQLYKIYGDQIVVEDISGLRGVLTPERMDRLEVNGKEYDAAYFGKQDLTAVLPDFEYREFWRLEGAYEDFNEYQAGQDVLPYNNYPMMIELEQVFLVKYRLKDGSDMEMYYVSRGNTWNNQTVTEQVLVPEH